MSMSTQKKCKSGDSENRNISLTRFDEIIRLTDVKILAITNHNHFDFKQYQEFREGVQDICQVWPGIELDVIVEDGSAHLIVVVNPNMANKFSEVIEDLLEGSTADNFMISIEDTVKNFDALDAIYIAHYYSKKPSLSDEHIHRLTNLISNEKRVLKEATNAISAGIYISHGHNSIYGSDVQNWEDYQEQAKRLPELRLPVESFEQFCLLLDKDDITINTILDRKTPDSIQLNVFGIAELIELDLFNDINILFGSKGTGKTEILKAISKYYNNLGIKNEVYVSSSVTLEEVYDVKGGSFDTDVESIGIDNCIEELKRLRCASEENVTSMSAYLRFFSAEETNRISQQLQIKNMIQLDDSSHKREFDTIAYDCARFVKFLTVVSSNELLNEVVGDELIKELITVLNKIIIKLKSESGNKFVDYRSLTFYNTLIQTFVSEIAKKTGQPQKPTSTGFMAYASNRIKIERDIIKITDNIATSIPPTEEYVGNLGEKGELRCKTNICIQDGSFTDSNYQPIKKVSKKPQKIIARKLKEVTNHLYSHTLFEKINELKQVDGSETITSVSDFLLFYRHFTIDNDYYSPSSGESSMVLLHNELMQNKEIYLIDEPEKSLGNDYISNVIVPLLNEKSRCGKKIVIATHDANIAVRTLPYNSIYREHDANGYYTYQGNPFSNNLISSNPSKPDINWKEICMKTLEGGKEAFGERGKIYGNT
jgi:predicted ATPase